MPVLNPEYRIAWEAFQDLHSCRQVGMGGPSPIAESEILAWLDLRQICEVESRICLCMYVKALDNKWFVLKQEDSNAAT